MSDISKPPPACTARDTRERALGYFLWRARRLAGMALGDVAHALDRTISRVCDIEHGYTTPTPEELRTYADTLHFSKHPACAALRELVLALYADDAPRRAAIRRAARFLVSHGEADPRVVRLAALNEP